MKNISTLVIISIFFLFYQAAQASPPLCSHLLDKAEVYSTLSNSESMRRYPKAIKAKVNAEVSERLFEVYLRGLKDSEHLIVIESSEEAELLTLFSRKELNILDVLSTSEMREIIIKASFGLAVNFSYKFLKTNIYSEPDDILQSALEGLTIAVDTYAEKESAREFSFSNVAYKSISKSVRQGAVKATSHIQGINITDLFDYGKFKTFRNNYLSANFGETPKDQELIDEYNRVYKRKYTIGRYKKLKLKFELNKSVASFLYGPLDTNEEGIFDEYHLSLDAADLMTGSLSVVEEEVYKSNVNDKINSVMEKLDEKELRFIRMKFGFGEGTNESMTLQEIGDIEGISRERVRQVIAAAVKRLRLYLRNDSISEEDVAYFDSFFPVDYQFSN